MKPLEFELRKTINQSAQEICTEIADVINWSDFAGVGLLPGIANAEYEEQTEDLVGSRMRVQNKEITLT